MFDELSHYVEPKTLKAWMEHKLLEIVPLPMMRGRTFNKCFVILDEAQNCTKAELRMFATRLGLYSKMVIVGDKEQSDLPAKDQGAFSRAIVRLAGIEGIVSVELGHEDVVRHPLLAMIDKKLA